MEYYNMANKATVGFISLGCSKNLCDTEVMLRHLVDAVRAPGAPEVDHGDPVVPEQVGGPDDVAVQIDSLKFDDLADE